MSFPLSPFRSMSIEFETCQETIFRKKKRPNLRHKCFTLRFLIFLKRSCYLFIDNQAKKKEIKDKLLVVISITTCVDHGNLT